MRKFIKTFTIYFCNLGPINKKSFSVIDYADLIWFNDTTARNVVSVGDVINWRYFF